MCWVPQSAGQSGQVWTQTSPYRTWQEDNKVKCPTVAGELKNKMMFWYLLLSQPDVALLVRKLRPGGEDCLQGSTPAGKPGGRGILVQLLQVVDRQHPAVGAQHHCQLRRVEGRYYRYEDPPSSKKDPVSEQKMS